MKSYTLRIIQNIISKSVLLIVFINLCMLANAQMQVNLILSPPYSPYFSDYLQYENKGFVTVVDPAFVNGTSKAVYMIGNITGDNGISLKTKPGYKPGSPIFLNSSSPVSTLKGSEFADIFSWDNMIITGISAKKLVQNDGLPEGNYTICIQIFDYETDVALSNPAPQGCFNLPIKHIEPPIPISPLCEGNVYLTKPQNVVLSWSFPVGAPAATKYILRIVPLVNPAQNPTDALNTITTPPFFEKELNVTTYVYSISDPILVEDQAYAWRVIAYDPLDKVLFRNNGVSAACIFQTKKLLSKPEFSFSLPTLFLSSPDCSTAKKDSIIVSSESDLTIAWNWFLKKKNGEDSAIKEKQPIKGSTIGKYRIMIKALGLRGSKKAKADDVLERTFYTKAEDPHLKSFTMAACDSMGLKHNYWYEVEVTALDNATKSLGSSKCSIRYLKKLKSAIPSLSVKGRLRYEFDDFTEKTGANFVSLRCEIVDAKAKNNSQLAKAAVSFSVVCKTDKNGNFKITLPDKTNIDKKYLRIDIENLYYVNFTENFALFNSSIPDAKSPIYADTLTLPELTTKVVKYKLRVDVTMGFSDYFYDTLTKGFGKKTFTVDTLTIKPKAKIPKNIQMVLYRKKKNENIPQFEGLGTKVEKLDKENIIRVADAMLQYEMAGGIEKAFVNFDRLIPSFYSGDEYYLKAKFLDAEKSESETVDLKNLEAPILTIAIKKPHTGPEALAASFKSKINYRLISNKPPVSKIKGKLVYVWPSDNSNQERPMANVEFSVISSYLINGIAFEPYEKGCVGDIYALYNEYGMKISSSDDQSVVGVGKTDENGNFELDVININQKGTLSKKGSSKRIASFDKCGKKNTKDPAKGNPIEELINEVYDPWDGGFDKGGIWESDYDMGMNFGDQKGLKPQETTNTLLNGGDITVNGVTGLDNSGAKKGMEKGSMFKSGGIPGEVEFTEDQEMAEGEEDIYGTVERIYQIVINGEHSNYYFNPLSTADGKNKIVCQAFDTKDIGVYKSTVKEMSIKIPKPADVYDDPNILKISVYKKKATSGYEKMPGFNLATAKYVVFRSQNTPTSLFPKGEGSAIHPIKPLLQSKLKEENIATNSSESDIKNNLGNKFEWVLDAPQDIGSGSSINFNDKLLLNSAKANYFVQITPDPSQGQVFFKPVIAYSRLAYVDIYLSASRIAGRILDMSTKNTTQKGLPNATILIKNTTKNILYFLNSDENGYYELLNQSFSGSKFVNWDDNNNFDILVMVSGYKVKSSSTTIKAVGEQRIIDFQMEPSRTFSAFVQNEDKTPVVAFVMRNDSSIYKTSAWGIISKMPLEDKTGIEVTIIPKDVKYFEETIVISEKGDININPIIVKKRLHRMHLKVKDAVSGKFLENITIEINNDHKGKTNIGGVAKFTFENVSVNNYVVTITDPKGNYIPKKISLINKESKDFILYEIDLKEGMMLKGNVTLNGTGVKNAKVYIDIKKSSAKTLSTTLNTEALEARTDNKGNYLIKGIPSEFLNLVVKASHDTAFVVNGDFKDIELIPGTGSLKPTNLNLTAFEDLVLKRVFNYPFQLEKIVKKTNEEYLISGLFDFTDTYNGFSGSNFNTRPNISDVPFIVKIIDGKRVLVPRNDKLELEVYSLKLTFLDKINVILTRNSGNPLLLEKDNTGGGVLKAKVRIVDNSFDFPSSYFSFGNQFYFCDDQGAMFVNTLISSSISSSVNKKYNICDKESKGVMYKFIGFDAQSDISKCYIDDKAKLHLNGKMKCTMAKASQGVIELSLDEIILSDNQIEVPSSGKPIEIKLEQWSLQVKNWSMSPEKGGLNSSNCILKTGVVDIPVGEFTLTKHFYYMDKFNVSNISLGGVFDLSEINSSLANLVFDEKTGSDMGAHWKLVIAGKDGKPAAKINNLEPILDKPIEVEYIQLISNGKESIVTLKNSGVESKLWNNNFVNFKPTVLASGDGFASIAGTASFKVPRMNPIAIQLIFKRKFGVLLLDVNPVSIKFEGKGYVKFASKEKPVVSNGLFEMKGSVEEKGKFNAIPAWLKIGVGVGVARIYLPNNGIEGSPLANDYHLNLTEKSLSPSSKGNNLRLSSDLTKNGMYVTGSDWTTLKFSGNLIEGKTASDKKYLKESNILDFEVYGEIQANSKKLELGENLEFGAFKMSYDFANSRLNGTLHCSKKYLGDNFSLEGADLEMCFDPGGWYLLGSGKLNTGTFLTEGLGIFNAGFLLGMHAISPEMNSTVTKYSKTNTACLYLNKNSTNFSGFFFTGGWDVIDKSEDFNFGVAWGEVQALLGVEATLALNFNSSTEKFFLAGTVMGKLEASLGSVTGTSICASAVNELHGGASFSSLSNLTITGGSGISLTGCITQWMPPPKKDLTFGVQVEAGIDYVLKPAGPDRFAINWKLGTPEKNINNACNEVIQKCSSCK